MAPLSLDLTLPNVECDNCTLQLIQMMIDKPPYSTATTSDDICFACVDLVLSATAPIPDAGPGPDAGDSNGGSSGGCSAFGSVPGLLVLAAFGLLLRRRART